ncbi:unnamed protein product [Adineta ricciae]|uniref:Uncharacterized protein n=1 Tax=Adineta ricciae TaxID=249248 RepID=A0A813UU11_ADIRI|nr:unnamed protein product [Adineta ricciae]
MGCGCCSHASTEKDTLRVTIVGLENSGKTSLVQCLKTSKKSRQTSLCVSTHGVISINIQTNMNFLVFDCGGCKHQRHIWPHIMNSPDVILFAVDSMDLTCLNDAREALSDLLVDENLINKPLLVIFTKSDRENKLSIDQLEQTLDLSVIKDRSVHTVLFSSVTLEGLTTIREWLTYFSYRKLQGKDMNISTSERHRLLHSLNLSTA